MSDVLFEQTFKPWDSEFIMSVKRPGGEQNLRKTPKNSKKKTCFFRFLKKVRRECEF